MVKDIRLAELAYNAYGTKANWRTYDDKPMPLWCDLGDVVRLRWLHAAVMVKNLVLDDFITISADNITLEEDIKL